MSQSKNPQLRVQHLSKHFPLRKGFFGRAGSFLRAVHDVSFVVEDGETLGLVGESGCGKTTTGRVILNLEPATAGSVHIGDSPDLTRLSSREWFPYRRRAQMIFQDPYSSLNPRMTVGAMIGEAIAVHRLARGAKARRERIAQLMEQVGMAPDAMHRYPHEFSGGQRQRIGIARALAVEPRLIIADEPVSALDVSIQAQIINLLRQLQKTHGLSFVFISHDLSVVGHISHRVAVMYLGQIVEIGPKGAIFNTPKHPYTEALLHAIPVPDPAFHRKRILLPGDMPDAANIPPGCPFHPRCPRRFEGCDREVPSACEVAPDHWVTCRLYSGNPREAGLPAAPGKEGIQA